MKVKFAILPLLTMGLTHGATVQFGNLRSNFDGSDAFSVFSPSFGIGDTATSQNETFSVTDNVATWTFDIIADYNGNGTNSIADDGYATFTVTATTSAASLPTTTGISVWIANNQTITIDASINTSNLTGTVDSAGFQLGGVRLYVGGVTTAGVTGATATLGAAGYYDNLNTEFATGEFTTSSFYNGDSQNVQYTLNNTTGSGFALRDLGFRTTISSTADSVTVPEPSALALLGLGGLALVARRKR